jgi:hypothetical protein
MQVPQPPVANRAAAAKPARKPPLQFAAKSSAAELLKAPIAPPSVELPPARPPTMPLEPAMPSLPVAPLLPPQPDHALIDSATPAECVSQSTAELLPAPLLTMTPEPAPLAPSTSFAAEPDYLLSNRGTPAEYLGPPPIDLQSETSSSPEPMLMAFEAQTTIDIPRATPVETTAESPFESLPVLELVDLGSSPTDSLLQTAAELPPAPPELTLEPDLVSIAADASSEPEPSATETNPESTAAFHSQPTVELHPVDQPTITPETAMVPLLLTSESEEDLQRDKRAPHTRREHDKDRFETRSHQSAAEVVIDDAITLRRSRGVEFLSWLHNHLPSRPDHIPADAIEPTWAEQRTARGLAAALAAAAVMSVVPIVLKSYVNLLAAPPWALWTVLLAAVQLIFAGWLANAPDWATVRVQMILSAAITTIYAMVMTLVLVTPQSRTLILGLDEVRHMAPAWCGIMFAVMAAFTWYCGRTSTHWRRQLTEEI